MTIKEAISDVLHGVNESTDDFNVSRRWIYAELLSARAELLKQELNKKRLLDGVGAQSLTDLKLVISDISGGNTYNQYPILRSQDLLPAFVEFDEGLAIHGIYLKNGKEIPLISKSVLWAKKGRRFNKNDEFAFIDKGYLFLDGFSDLEEIEVDIPGYFYDPVAAGVLADKQVEKSCKAAYDYEFYTPGHIFRRIKEIVRPVVLRRLGIPTDRENNAKLDLNAGDQVQSQTR